MNAETEQLLFMNPDLPEKRPALPADLGVDSPVVVIRPGRRQGPVPAKVVDRGRTWITVELDPQGRNATQYRFRLDDQTDGSGSHYAFRFATPQQREWDEASNSAWKYLADQKIRVDRDSPWWYRPMELARMLWAAG